MMKNTGLFGLFAAVVAIGSAAAGFYAGNMNAPEEVATTVEPTVIAAEGAVNQAQVETIVRDYLLKNPEIMEEVQTALETKRNGEAKAAQTALLAKSGADLFQNANDAVPKGDVTVVEFFDYNCGYCRRAMADMDQLVQSDPNVRFVLKELPILGPDSVKAHIVAQSFHKLHPEKYGEFHRALLGAGHADEASAIATAVSLGANEAALREGMESPDIGKLFEANNNLAQGLNITGTPSYVIRDAIVPGAMGYETLAEKVSNVRKCQSATC
jgi:protein-disulfide isomerase